MPEPSVYIPESVEFYGEPQETSSSADSMEFLKGQVGSMDIAIEENKESSSSASAETGEPAADAGAATGSSFMETVVQITADVVDLLLVPLYWLLGW